jgi:hypothetical protein
VQQDGHEFEYISHDDYYPSVNIEGQFDDDRPHGERQTSSHNHCEDYNGIVAATTKGRHTDDEYRPTPPPHHGRQGSIVVEHITTPEAANTIPGISCEFILG